MNDRVSFLASTSTAGSSTSTSTGAPQLLTKTAISELTDGFDAGDTLECYLLQRVATLNGFQSLPVVKHLLAIRYIPPSNAYTMHGHPHPLSLTLEYGPMRVAGLHEAIPILVSQESAPGEESLKHISWDNQARVYYTNAINSTLYKSANYMASLTGAVLKNLLDSANEYALLKPRYQPFTVVNPETGRIMLRSHSDLDFIKAMFSQLAEMGVELAPILKPSDFQLRLYASNIARVEAIDESTRTDIFDFYAKLYQCLDQTATAQSTSIHEGTESPTAFPSTAPSVLPRLLKGAGMAQNTDSEASVTSSASPSSSPSSEATQPVDHSDQAQQAADEAHKAAQDAKDSGNDEAAEAASKAADAAQKAADATANQQALINQKALLSGDGRMACQAILPCLHSPSTNSTVDSYAYVYVDGSFFFRLLLASPFIGVSRIDDYELPSPPQYSTYTGGDIVDWSLFFLFSFVFCFGILMLVQELCGRKYRYFVPLYRFQRWFFDPTHNLAYDPTDDGLDGNNINTFGEGMAYTFGEDVIPLSMGGRKALVFHGESGTQLDSYAMDGDFELSEFVNREGGGGELGSSYHSSKNGSIIMDEDELMDSSVRMRRRDSDLVELPNLSSSSKVAVPVSMADVSSHE